MIYASSEASGVNHIIHRSRRLGWLMICFHIRYIPEGGARVEHMLLFTYLPRDDWWCYTGWVKRVIWTFCRITSPFFVLHHTFSVLPHPFGITFTLFPYYLILLVLFSHFLSYYFTFLVLFSHFLSYYFTLLVLHHPFATMSYEIYSVNLTFIALLLTTANPELL